MGRLGKKKENRERERERERETVGNEKEKKERKGKEPSARFSMHSPSIGRRLISDRRIETYFI